MSKTALPTRGLAFGAYPQRGADAEPSALDAWWRAAQSRLSRCHARPLPPAWAGQLARARAALDKALDPAQHKAQASRQPDAQHGQPLRPAAPAGPLLQSQAAGARRQLRREGLAPAAVARALVLAAWAAEQAHGLRAYDTQLQAAWLMLTGHLVEMATGEGKTLATALAAAVAGLAGSPVHVITANDYLVARDAAAQSPFFALLGLGCVAVTQTSPPEARAALWRHDIVYTSARELAFDYLRDHLALQGERDARLLRAQALGQSPGTNAGPGAGPTLPGLCFALIDEADSVLLDEATVPLLLAQQVPASPADVQAWQRAYQLAGRLRRQRDYQLPPGSRQPRLTDEGRQRVAAAVQGQGGLLHPARRAQELVEAALAARRSYLRDRDYLVVNGALQLIDTLTGRIADGRQWQGALHPMVEIKEGLVPSHPTRTAAQITYQRFFPRYLHLGGMSGTLREARHELRLSYRCAMAAVPLARADLRRWLGLRVFADAPRKWAAVLAAVQQHSQAGRPVLVGTDSVADSLQLSARLQAAGLAHQVLNATQDAAEAQAVARAGQAGTITVATNIAGRGTDIRLDAAARGRGGLHVIATMANRSRRIDRQLLGRAARHGDPGSAEAILALDDALPRALLPPALRRALAAWAQRCTEGRLPDRVAHAVIGRLQALAERQDRQRRAALRQSDLQAEALFGFGGGIE